MFGEMKHENGGLENMKSSGDICRSPGRSRYVLVFSSSGYRVEHSSLKDGDAPFWGTIYQFGAPFIVGEVDQVIRRTTCDLERRTSDSFVEHVH